MIAYSCKKTKAESCLHLSFKTMVKIAVSFSWRKKKKSPEIHLDVCIQLSIHHFLFFLIILKFYAQHVISIYQQLEFPFKVSDLKIHSRERFVTQSDRT